MAIISCLTSADGLQGVVACLHESENLTGILAVVVLTCGWLALQLLSEARCRRQNEGIHAAAKVAVPFGSRQHAEGVWHFANNEMYQYLMAELEKALTAEGYVLTRNPDRRITLLNESKNRVARAVFLARERYMVPVRSEENLNAAADEGERTGFSAQWLSSLIDGSEGQGWYITRPQ